MSEREAQPRLCYACGVDNEHGLHMQFRREGERTIADYEPAEFQQGYPGRLHGGIVATMIDEAMGWAVYHAAKWGATARLNVRYRQPVSLDEPLRVEAWVVRDHGRLIELRAELRDRTNRLLAEGEGSFMKLDARKAREMSQRAQEAGRPDAPEVVP